MTSFGQRTRIFLRKKRLLFILLLVGTVLRIINPTFGSPVLYIIPDEVANYVSAWNMLANKTLMTISHYPPFGSYIMLPFLAFAYLFSFITKGTSLESFQFFLATHEGYYLFIPRLISAIFAVGSIWVYYSLARLIFPKIKTAAYWTVILLVFSLSDVQMSHIGKPWMPAMFFISLSVYFAVKSIFSKNEVSSTVISGIFLGIAVGFNFVALFFIILFLYFRLIISRHRPWFCKINLISIGALIIPVSIFIFSFIVKTGAYLPLHLEALRVFNITLKTGPLHVIKAFLWEFLIAEPILVTGFILSLFYFRKWSKAITGLVIFSVIYFLIFSLACIQSVRYLLPILPLLAILSGFSFFHILSLIKPAVLKFVIKAVLVLFIAFPSLYWAICYINQPTFLEAAGWINKNISKETMIAYAGVRFAGFTPAYRSIELHQEKNPKAYSRAKKFLKPGQYPDNVREVIYLENAAPNLYDLKSVKEYIRQHDIRYVIDAYWDPQTRIFPGNDNFFLPEKSFTPFIKNNGEDIGDFIHWYGNIMKLLKINRFGPYVEIFRINNESD